MTDKPITILEIIFTKERFPNLYRVAERNPEGLAEQLRGLARASGSENLESVATTLEHDLEHERLSQKP